MPTAGNLGNQGSNVFLVHALEALLSGRLEVKRPDLLHMMTFPLESWTNDVESGMEYGSKYIDDWAGEAKVRARDTIDVPMMGMSSEKLTVQMFEYAIGNRLDNRTKKQGSILARRGFSSDPMTLLPQIGNSAMKEAYERLLIFGDTIQDAGGSHYPGFINNPNVDIGTSIGNWSTLDPEQIIADIQTAIVSIIEGSNTTHIPNTLLLPTAQYNLIATTKAGTRANDETILNYVKTQGIAAEENGGQIDIFRYRYLKDAGGVGVDRMIAYEKEADNFIIANPIDFAIDNVLPVPYGNLYTYLGEISNLKITYPKSMVYYDGI